MNKLIQVLFILLLLYCNDLPPSEHESKIGVSNKTVKWYFFWQVAANNLAMTRNPCTYGGKKNLASGETDNGTYNAYIIQISNRGTPTLDVTLKTSNCWLRLDTQRCYGSQPAPDDLDSTFTTPGTRTYTVTRYPENQFVILANAYDSQCQFTIHVY